MSAKLNYEQLSAVNCLQGPCLVLAGAGSGKTRVITQKIAKLLELGLAPQNIAAITFTNKAAEEMRSRARAIVGRMASKLLICTFHSLGVRILRQHGELIGLREKFSILSSDDALTLLKEIGVTTDLNTVRLWQWQIGEWKNRAIDADTALATATSKQQQHIALIYHRFQEQLAAYQSVDFDDLILLPLKILTEHAVAKEYWQEQLKYILVDEYQDTNAVQYAFLKQLVAAKQNFTVVGDDDQSIYGWRGATLENLRQLPEDFVHLKIIKLEQNYRSTTAILQAANNVIANNPKLFPKKIWSDLGAGDAVKVASADNEEHEAERCVFRLQQLKQNPQSKWHDFAILYRANHQAKYLEQALKKANIPYKISGGQSVFDKTEIKDLCAWFRLIINPQDDLAFIRSITHPKRGIGHNTLQSLSSYAGQYKLSLYAALFSANLSSCLTTKALEGLKLFGLLVEQIAEQSEKITTTNEAKEFFKQWLDEIGYEQHLYRYEENEQLAVARWENVLDFCDWVARRLTPPKGEDVAPSVNLFDAIQTISLYSMLSEKDDRQDQVTLSTLHAAKGLEWPHVMLVGVNEDLLPFKIEDEESANKLVARIHEERRLMYVGITRAQKTLQISWLSKRKKGRNIVIAKPSRFIAEMQLAAPTKVDNKERLQQIRAKLLAKTKEQQNNLL